MKFHELSHWPPQWQPLLIRSKKLLIGEIGVLKSVKPLFVNDGYLNIMIEYEGTDYTGLLQVDPSLRNQIFGLLEKQKGRAIGDIAQLEIS
jgi:hypothetical protein